jgi:hypothetical protein
MTKLDQLIIISNFFHFEGKHETEVSSSSDHRSRTIFNGTHHQHEDGHHGPPATLKVAIQNGHTSLDNKKLDELDDPDPLLYALEDIPPWYMCLFLGFQVRLKILIRKPISSYHQFCLLYHCTHSITWK